MSITMQFLLLVVAACVFLSEGAAKGQAARAMQQRPIRFRNPMMMTARGFGNRGGFFTRTEPYGLDNLRKMLKNSDPREGQDFNEDKFESISIEWFLTAILNNFARSMERKFMDLHKDGMLTTDELIRNMD